MLHNTPFYTIRHFTQYAILNYKSIVIHILRHLWDLAEMYIFYLDF